MACGAAAPAQENRAFDPRLAGSPVYSDPGFQDYIETSYGYLNPRNRARVRTDFRDAVASPEARKPRGAAARPVKYVFVSILPKARDYSALLGELSASSGFIFSGERTVYARNSRKTRLLGWVRADRLAAVRANPGVAGVRQVRPARKAKAL